MMTMRELITEYILFAFSDEELMERFNVLANELQDLPDLDLLEIYDMTLMLEIEDAGAQF
jgi:hypothetical protein